MLNANSGKDPPQKKVKPFISRWMILEILALSDIVSTVGTSPIRKTILKFIGVKINNKFNLLFLKYHK